MNTKKTRFTLDMNPLFQRRLKVMATIMGLTMRQYCLTALEKELAADEAKGAKMFPFEEEAVNRLAALQAEVFEGRKLDGDSAELIHETRNTRDTTP